MFAPLNGNRVVPNEYTAEGVLTVLIVLFFFYNLCDAITLIVQRPGGFTLGVGINQRARIVAM